MGYNMPVCLRARRGKQAFKSTLSSEQWEISIAGSSFSDEEETGEGRS